MSTRTATCCTNLCGLIGLFVGFLCCSGVGLGFYLSGCDPNGYCKGGITKATATGVYSTTQHLCSTCVEKCENAYGGSSDDCCDSYYFNCWDSFATFSYKKWECTMQVDTDNDNQDDALADAASKYPKGKTVTVQSVAPSDDSADGSCTTAMDAKTDSYFGIAFLSIAGIILCSLFVVCVKVYRENQTLHSPSGSAPTTGVEMVSPGTMIIPNTMATVPSAPSPPQSYPYSTYVSAPQSVGYAGQPYPYQPVVSYGPPGPALMYSALPNQPQQPQVYILAPQQQQVYVPAAQSHGYVVQAVVADETIV